MIKQDKRFWDMTKVSAILFNNLVYALSDVGYYVQVQDTGYEQFAYVTGRSIIAGFCTHTDPDERGSPQYMNGRICVDNEKEFSRWGTCYLCLPLPKNKSELTFLIGMIDFISTKENIGEPLKVVEYPTTKESNNDELGVNR